MLIFSVIPSVFPVKIYSNSINYIFVQHYTMKTLGGYTSYLFYHWKQTSLPSLSVALCQSPSFCLYSTRKVCTCSPVFSSPQVITPLAQSFHRKSICMYGARSSSSAIHALSLVFLAKCGGCSFTKLLASNHSSSIGQIYKLMTGSLQISAASIR